MPKAHADDPQFLSAALCSGWKIALQRFLVSLAAAGLLFLMAPPSAAAAEVELIEVRSPTGFLIAFPESPCFLYAQPETLRVTRYAPDFYLVEVELGLVSDHENLVFVADSATSTAWLATQECPAMWPQASVSMGAFDCASGYVSLSAFLSYAVDGSTFYLEAGGSGACTSTATGNVQVSSTGAATLPAMLANVGKAPAHCVGIVQPFTHGGRIVLFEQGLASEGRAAASPSSTASGALALLKYLTPLPAP